MAYVPSSVLSPTPQPLGLAAVASIGLHVGGVVIFVGWTLLCGAGEPVRDLRPAMEIDFALVAQADVMPQVAMRTPTPPSFDKPAPTAPAPEPVPAAPEPPPPRESDLVIHTPEPVPAPPTPVAQTPAPAQPRPAPDNSADRQRVIDAAQRLEDLMNEARVGPRNQAATDPNGNSDITVGSGSGAVTDVELSRWRATTQARFAEVFSPIQNIPGLKAVVRVTIDPESGIIRETRVLRTSGNASFDAAAERSATSLFRIDLPPPRYRDIVGSNLDITYEPK
jgi:outer membrane biosynthesis protein TonB